MARTRAIKDALITVLEGVEYKGEQAFTKVVGHTEGEFDDYPSIRILPGDQTAEKSTMSQDERTIRFIVRTHVELDGGNGFDYMYDLTDLILDTVNEADFADRLKDINPEIPTYMMEADRGDWFDAETQAGPVLMCDVNVEVRYSKDLNSKIADAYNSW